jgi:GMP synthase-like glutamine amidotransferase
MSDQLASLNKKTFCYYEPLRPKIEAMNALIIDNLLKNETDLSETARQEADYDPLKWLQEERHIACLALENITQNIVKLVKKPSTKIIHLSEFTEELLASFDPDVIIISGTLRDFDLYSTKLIKNFAAIVQKTSIPVLGICGGHQLVGLSFGAEIVTLDYKDPRKKRNGRIREYEYRYIKVTKPEDPIFKGMDDEMSYFWEAGNQKHVLRVWQNHGLMVDRVPEGFTNLAKSYLCPIQMMVKRGDGQLFYTVQYHLEKSFEDWNKLPTRWEHRNDCRDGRIVFENFLVEALKHRKKIEKVAKIA